MRYCAHCGHVIDEYDFYRNSFNCRICDAILLEDDMTALKYANLTEMEKDAYDEQLLSIIKNSIGFDKYLFEKYCSTKDGKFWEGFRPEKYLKLYVFKEEKYRQNYFNYRKANEPFKPFPEIDTVKAREVAKDAEIVHKAIERGYYSSKPVENNNIPQCPTCSSTNIRKMGAVESGASIALFGIFSKKINKTFKCKDCGYTW